MRNHKTKKITCLLLAIFYLVSYILQSLSYADFGNKVYAANTENKIDYTNIVAILVDDTIYQPLQTEIQQYAKNYIQGVNSSSLFGGGTGYSRYNSISNSKAIILPVNTTNVTAPEITKILENLYFDGIEGVSSKLVGIVLIGNIPLPVVNQNGFIFPTIYPYVDFEDQKFIWDDYNQYFVYNDNEKGEAELWHGWIKFDTIAEYNSYFSKLKAYSNNPSSYIGKSIWYDDFVGNRTFFYDDGVNAYVNNFLFAEDLGYKRFSDLMIAIMQGQQNESVANVLQNLGNVLSGTNYTGNYAEGMTTFLSTPELSTPTMTIKKILYEGYINSYTSLLGAKYMNMINDNVTTANRWIEQYTGSDNTASSRSSLDTHYIKIEEKDETLLRNNGGLDPLLISINNLLEDFVDDKVASEKYWLNEVIPLTYLEYQGARNDWSTCTWSKYDAYENYFFGRQAKYLTSMQDVSSYRGTYRNYQGISGLTINDIQNSQQPSTDLDIDLNKKSVGGSYEIFAQQVDANRGLNTNNTITELNLYEQNKTAARGEWSLQCEKKFLGICWKRRKWHYTTHQDSDGNTVFTPETPQEYAIRNWGGASPLNLDEDMGWTSGYNFQDAITPVYDIGGSKAIATPEYEANSFQGVNKYTRMIQRKFVVQAYKKNGNVRKKFRFKNKAQLNPDSNGRGYNSSMGEDLLFTNLLPSFASEDGDDIDQDDTGFNRVYTQPKLANSVNFFTVFNTPSIQKTNEGSIIKLAKRNSGQCRGNGQIYTYKTLDSRVKNSATNTIDIGGRAYKAFQDEESPIYQMYDDILEKLDNLNSELASSPISTNSDDGTGIIDNIISVKNTISRADNIINSIIDTNKATISGWTDTQISQQAELRSSAYNSSTRESINSAVEDIELSFQEIDNFFEYFSFEDIYDYISNKRIEFIINGREFIFLQAWKSNITSQLTSIYSSFNSQASSLGSRVNTAKNQYNILEDRLESSVFKNDNKINNARGDLDDVLDDIDDLPGGCGGRYSQLCSAISTIRYNLDHSGREVADRIKGHEAASESNRVNGIKLFYITKYKKNGKETGKKFKPFNEVGSSTDTSDALLSYTSILQLLGIIPITTNSGYEIQIQGMNITTSDRPIDSPKYLTFKGIGGDKVTFIYPDLYKVEVYTGNNETLTLLSPEEIANNIRKYLRDVVKKYNSYLTGQQAKAPNYYNQNKNAYDLLDDLGKLASPNYVGDNIRPYGLFDEDYLINLLVDKMNNNAFFTGNMGGYEPIEFLAHMIYYQNITWPERIKGATIQEDMNKIRESFDINQKVSHIFDNYIVSDHNSGSFITPGYRDDGYEVAYINSDEKDYIVYETELPFMKSIKSSNSSYKKPTSTNIEKSQLEEELVSECNIPEDGDGVLLFDLSTMSSPWIDALKCRREKLKEKPLAFNLSVSFGSSTFGVGWNGSGSAGVAYEGRNRNALSNDLSTMGEETISQLGITTDTSNDVLNNASPQEYEILDKINKYVKINNPTQSINADVAKTSIKITSSVDFGNIYLRIISVGNNKIQLSDNSNMISANITQGTTAFSTGNISINPFESKTLNLNFVNPNTSSSDVIVFYMCPSQNSTIDKCIKKTLTLYTVPGEIRDISILTPGDTVMQGSQLPIKVVGVDQYGNNVGQLLTERFTISTTIGSLVHQGVENSAITFSNFDESDFVLYATGSNLNGQSLTVKVSGPVGDTIIEKTKNINIVKGKLNLTSSGSTLNSTNNTNIKTLNITLPDENIYSYTDEYGVTQASITAIPKLTVRLSNQNGQTLNTINTSLYITSKKSLLNIGSIYQKIVNKNTASGAYSIPQNRFAQTNTFSVQSGIAEIYLLPNFKAGNDTLYLSIPGIDTIQINVNINSGTPKIVNINTKSDNIKMGSNIEGNIKVYDNRKNLVTNNVSIRLGVTGPLQISGFVNASQIINVHAGEKSFIVKSRDKGGIGYVYGMIENVGLADQQAGYKKLTVQDTILPKDKLNIMYLNLFGSDRGNQRGYLSDNNKYIQYLITHSDKLLTATTQLVTPSKLKSFIISIDKTAKISNLDDKEVNLQLTNNSFKIEVDNIGYFSISKSGFSINSITGTSESEISTKINSLTNSSKNSNNILIYIPEETDSIISTNKLTNNNIITINSESVLNFTNNTQDPRFTISLTDEYLSGYQLWQAKFDGRDVGKFIIHSNNITSKLSIHVENSDYDNSTVWLQGSTNKVGWGIYEIDSAFDDSSLGYKSIQDSIDPEAGIGFTAEFKNITNFGAGQSVGESTVPFGSEFLINIGDPLLKRIDDNETAKVYDTNGTISEDTEFDKGLGELIYSDTSKKIFKVINIDFNNDNLEDILVIYSDGTIKLLKNYGGTDPFRELGPLMVLADRIKDVITGDVDGNGYDDIIIWTEGNILRVYHNYNGIFEVDGYPICININVHAGEVSQTPSKVQGLLQIFFEDMDNDGSIDIVTNDELGFIKIFYGGKNNSFNQDNYVSTNQYMCDNDWYKRLSNSSTNTTNSVNSTNSTSTSKAGPSNIINNLQNNSSSSKQNSNTSTIQNSSTSSKQNDSKSTTQDSSTPSKQNNSTSTTENSSASSKQNNSTSTTPSTSKQSNTSTTKNSNIYTTQGNSISNKQESSPNTQVFTTQTTENSNTSNKLNGTTTNNNGDLTITSVNNSSSSNNKNNGDLTITSVNNNSSNNTPTNTISNEKIVHRFAVKVNPNVEVLDNSFIRRQGINPNEQPDINLSDLGIDTSAFAPESTGGIEKMKLSQIKDKFNIAGKLEQATNFDVSAAINIYSQANRYQVINFGKIPAYESGVIDENDIQYVSIGWLDNNDPIKVYKKYEDINGDVLEDGDKVEVTVTLHANRNVTGTFVDNIAGPWIIPVDEELDIIENFRFESGTVTPNQVNNIFKIYRDLDNAKYMIDNIGMKSGDTIKIHYRLYYEGTDIMKISLKDVDGANYSQNGIYMTQYPADGLLDIKTQPTDGCNPSMYVFFNEGGNVKRDYQIEYIDLGYLMNNISNTTQANYDDSVSDLTNSMLSVVGDDGKVDTNSVPGMSSILESSIVTDMFSSTFSLDSILQNNGIDLSNMLDLPNQIIDGLLGDITNKISSFVNSSCGGFSLKSLLGITSCNTYIPFNESFLGAGDYHLFGCFNIQPLTQLIGKGMPLLNIPGNRGPTPYGYIPAPGLFGYPRKGATDSFSFGNDGGSYPSFFRLYVMPTLTAEIGFALCFGPYATSLALPDPMGSVGGNCVVFTVPLPCNKPGKDDSEQTETYDPDILEEFADIPSCEQTTNTPSLGANQSNSCLQLASSSSNSTNMTTMNQGSSNSPRDNTFNNSTFMGGFITIDKQPSTMVGYSNDQSPVYIEIDGVELLGGADSKNKILGSAVKGLIEKVAKAWLDKQIKYTMSTLTNFYIGITWPDLSILTEGRDSLAGNFTSIVNDQYGSSADRQDCKAQKGTFINGQCITPEIKCTNKGKQWKNGSCVEKTNKTSNDKSLDSMSTRLDSNRISQEQISDFSESNFANPLAFLETAFEDVPLINITTEKVTVKVPMITSEDLTAYISTSQNRLNRQKQVLKEREDLIYGILSICGGEKINNISELKDAVTEIKEQLAQEFESTKKGLENDIKDLKNQLKGASSADEKARIQNELNTKEAQMNELIPYQNKIDAQNKLNKKYDLTALGGFTLLERNNGDFLLRLSQQLTYDIIPNDIYLLYNKSKNTLTEFTQGIEITTKKKESGNNNKIVVTGIKTNGKKIVNGELDLKEYATSPEEQNQCVDLFLGGSFDAVLDGFLGLETNANNLINSVKTNLETLDLYKKFPSELYEWIHMADTYLSEISSFVSSFLGTLSMRINTNATRYSQYVNAIITLMTTIETYQAIIDLAANFNKKCSTCSNDNYDQFTCKLGLLCPDGLLPTLPIPPMKIPSIYLDFSNINIGTDIKIPSLNFQTISVDLPELPDLPSPPSINLDIDSIGELGFNAIIDEIANLFDINLNININGIPQIPSPPNLPNLPDLDIEADISLPLLPPAPKIPALPNEISALIDAAEYIGEILCLVKRLPLVNETSVKAKIEQLSQRTYEVPYRDTMDQTFQSRGDKISSSLGSSILKQFMPFLSATEFKDIEVKGFDISLESYINLQLNFNEFYEIIDSMVEGVNSYTTSSMKMVESLNNEISQATTSFSSDLQKCISNPLDYPECFESLGIQGYQSIISQFKDITGKLNSIKDYIKNGFSSISIYRQELVDLGNEINSINEDIDEKEKGIRDIKNKIATNENKLKATNSDLEKAQLLANIAMYEDQLEQSNKELENLEDKLENKQTKYGILTKKYGPEIEAYDTAMDTYNTLYEQYQAISSEVDNMKELIVNSIAQGTNALSNGVSSTLDKLNDLGNEIQSSTNSFDNKQQNKREQRYNNLENLYKEIDDLSYNDTYDENIIKGNQKLLAQTLNTIKEKTDNSSTIKEIDSYLNLLQSDANIYADSNSINSIQKEYTTIINNYKKENTNIANMIENDYDTFLYAVSNKNTRLVSNDNFQVTLSDNLFTMNDNVKNRLSNSDNIYKMYLDFYGKNVDGYINAINNHSASELNMNNSVYELNKNYLYEIKEKTELAYNKLEQAESQTTPQTILAQNTSSSSSTNNTSSSSNVNLSNYFAGQIISTPEGGFVLANSEYTKEFQNQSIMVDINKDGKNDLILRDDHEIYIKYRNNNTSYDNTKYENGNYVYNISSYQNLVNNSNDCVVKINNIRVKLCDTNREVKNFKYAGSDFDNISISWTNSSIVGDNVAGYLVKLIHRIDLFDDKELIVKNSNKDLFDKKYIVVLPNGSETEDTKIELENGKKVNVISDDIFNVQYFNEASENINLTIRDIPRNRQYAEIYTLYFDEDSGLYSINSSTSNQIVGGPQIIADNNGPDVEIELYRPSIDKVIDNGESFEGYVSTKYNLKSYRSDNALLDSIRVADEDGVIIDKQDNIFEKTGYIELTNLLFTGVGVHHYYFVGTDINGNSSSTDVTLSIKVPNISITNIGKNINGNINANIPVYITAEINQDLDEGNVQFLRKRNNIWELMTGVIGGIKSDKYPLEPLQTIITGSYFDFGDDIGIYLTNGDLAAKVNPNNGQITIEPRYENIISIELEYSNHYPIIKILENKKETLMILHLTSEKLLDIKLDNNSLDIKDLDGNQFGTFNNGKAIIDNNDILLYVSPKGDIYTDYYLYGDYDFDTKDGSVIYSFRKDKKGSPLGTIKIKAQNILQ